MNTDIEERTVMCANYIIDNRCTVRAAAGYFGYSKSTVHKDVSQRLKSIDDDLYDAVRAVLDQNKAERHFRGGQATKQKYYKMRECG